MIDNPLGAAELAALRAYDTPTICNALEIVAPERRATGFTVEPLVCAFPELPPIVGYARTATIRAAEPAGRPAAEMRQQRLDYFRHLVAEPGPTVSVIQDLDGGRKAYGAFWGEVNSTIHQSLGCLGTVTDGSVRDLDAVATGFQFIADRIGPSHAHVHLVDFAVTVTVAGMVVQPNDLIHADRHGAVVIPHEVARQVPAAADLLGRREAVILEACRQPGFDVEALGRAMADADDIH
ncbi:MAG: RraA family protein [Alphaproteobacteria bacterium]|jgi:regulator of RNase E activity RraA|nr:RraA family protein [Alphaproteobacteria bacterium]MDP6812964.1 RraA family protein [Alphaproteobacteria bacterium]